MKYGKNVAGRTAVCLVTAFILSGCAVFPKESASEEASGPVGMESAPIVDYRVPESAPNILIDRSGYQSQGVKSAIVRGTRLPDQFRLVDRETGDVVYTGEIEDAVYRADMKGFVGHVDFGEYSDASGGQYYLECDYIGRSYDFPIGETIYRDLFEDLYQEIIESCQEGEASVEDVLALLIACERYGGVFADENGDEVPDVMAELRRWAEQIDYDLLDAEEKALYAAALAKFSYLYQKYDLEFANLCLKRASMVYSQAQAPGQRDANTFLALTELYRATGLYTYGNRILEYKPYFLDDGSFLDENGYLYGAMTYMVTKQRVDVELCNLFMDCLLARGEEISDRHEETVGFASARENGQEDVLRQARQISGANYVLRTYQYDCITEDFVHYLMGCNLQAESFYPDEENRGSYLILLAQLASIQEYRALEEA